MQSSLFFLYSLSCTTKRTSRSIPFPGERSKSQLVIYFPLSSLAFLFFHKWERSTAPSSWACSKGCPQALLPKEQTGHVFSLATASQLIPLKEQGLSQQIRSMQKMPNILCTATCAPSLPSRRAAALSREDFSPSPAVAKSKCSRLIKHSGTHHRHISCKTGNHSCPIVIVINFTTYTTKCTHC